MTKALHDRPMLFRRLRILQFVTVLFIAFLEIIQTITFIGEFEDVQPSSFYLSTATFEIFGIKLLYHIVIFMTLISTSYYVFRFTHRWYHGPYQTDIYIDFTLFYLWIVAGITNIFPLLKGKKWRCLDDAFGFKVKFLTRMLCEGYLFSTIIGWAMVLEFFSSTLLYLYLWRTREWWDKNLNVNDENESEKGINLENDHEITIESESSVGASGTQETPNSEKLALDLGPRFFT